MKREDGRGDGDGDVLSDDGHLDHVVPGPDIHQPAQGVPEEEEGEAAHQTVHCHQPETLAAEIER